MNACKQFVGDCFFFLHRSQYVENVSLCGRFMRIIESVKQQSHQQREAVKCSEFYSTNSLCKYKLAKATVGCAFAKGVNNASLPVHAIVPHNTSEFCSTETSNKGIRLCATVEKWCRSPIGSRSLPSFNELNHHSPISFHPIHLFISQFRHML